MKYKCGDIVKTLKNTFIILGTIEGHYRRSRYIVILNGFITITYVDVTDLFSTYIDRFDPNSKKFKLIYGKYMKQAMYIM